MKTDSPQTNRAGNGWFIAWLVGGVAIVVLSSVLTDYYFQHYWAQFTFMPVPMPPWEPARRMLIEWVMHSPLIALVYALIGLWIFRRRGWVAAVFAAAMAGCTCLCQTASGLGQL